MLKSIALFVFIVIFQFSNNLFAQDTLPKFTTVFLGKDKVQVSWTNPFNNMVQLVVQRSFDSLSYYRTIFSSQSPWLPKNGFIDNKVPIGYKVFYRIQYVFEGGAYFFTKAFSPSNFVSSRIADPIIRDSSNDNKPIRRYIKVYKPSRDTLFTTLEYNDYKKFRDSINRYTKDTILKAFDDDEVIIRPYIDKPLWKSSIYVYTNEKGFIRITIPLAKQKKYRIVFFTDSGEELFQINQVKETDLILDKSNFYKVGWYFFELYEEEKLKEKNKIYVSQDK